MDIEQIPINTKRIRARIYLDYQDIVENMINNKSLSASKIVTWIIRELITLQKYIAMLLIDKIQKEIGDMAKER